MLRELDFNQRSIKAQEKYLLQKAKELRAAQRKRIQLEMEARRKREEEEWQRQQEEWDRFERVEISMSSVRRLLRF